MAGSIVRPKRYGSQPAVSPFTFPAQGVEVPYLISGGTLEELSENSSQRLRQYRGRTGGGNLDEPFAENLARPIETCSSCAESGQGAEFHQGEYPYDQPRGMSPPTRSEFLDDRWPFPDQPNIPMHPLASEGPYLAVIFAGGSLRPTAVRLHSPICK
jgi:hypothetical protein